jgi:hypothetical protein
MLGHPLDIVYCASPETVAFLVKYRPATVTDQPNFCDFGVD